MKAMCSFQSLPKEIWFPNLSVCQVNRRNLATLNHYVAEGDKR